MKFTILTPSVYQCYFQATYSFNYRGNLHDEFLRLVCRRHRVSTAIHQLDARRANLLTVEDLLKLQEDVASLYLSGRPRIDNISSIHTAFVFRASKLIEAHTLTYVLSYFLEGWGGGGGGGEGRKGQELKSVYSCLTIALVKMI